VSGNFFEALGVGAALGRVFDPGDDVVSESAPVVVLSYRFWQNRFGGDPTVLNQMVEINGHSALIVGVAAQSFLGMMPGRSRDIYMPISMKKIATANWSATNDSRRGWLNLLAGLKAGVTPAQAQSEANSLHRAVLEQQLGNTGTAAATIELRPAAQGINELRRQWQEPFTILFLAVTLVLVIACASISNLILARSFTRQRDLSVRLALGASRAALMRHSLAEGLLLATAGGVIGLFIGLTGTEFFIRVLPRTTNGWITAEIDTRLLGFTFVLSVGVGLVLGLLPLLHLPTTSFVDQLRTHVFSQITNEAAPQTNNACR
jgi:ABC-type antimicrobial peptide transport system permease subunit